MNWMSTTVEEILGTKLLKCSMCGRYLLPARFHPNVARRGGRQAHCIDCGKKYLRDYIAINPKVYHAYKAAKMREYRQRGTAQINGEYRGGRKPVICSKCQRPRTAKERWTMYCPTCMPATISRARREKRQYRKGAVLPMD